MDAQEQARRLVQEDVEERGVRVLARQRQRAGQAKDAPPPRKKRETQER